MTTVRQQREEAMCSFCLRSESEIGKLVQGPGMYICDACIKACYAIVAGNDRTTSGRAPWERELSDEELLAQLPRLAVVGVQAERALTQFVRKGRAQGITWTRIGAALSMTRQSAWERFSGEQ